MNKKIILHAITALISVGLTEAHAENMPMPAAPGFEKCYGIAKAGMNDCASANHYCGGEAKVDRDPGEWISVPNGLCKRIAGGSLEPVDKKK